jgi:hypothetical protein
MTMWWPGCQSIIASLTIATIPVIESTAIDIKLGKRPLDSQAGVLHYPDDLHLL